MNQAKVIDMHDNYGMFSKAGRFTSEKYIIFQKKEEIMLNQPRYTKGSMIPDTNVRWNQLFILLQKSEAQQKRATTTSQTKKKDTIKSKKLEIQPFSKQTSREKMQKIHLDSNQPPPCGYYHPKYSEIDTSPHHIFEYDKTLLKTQPKLTHSKSSTLYPSKQIDQHSDQIKQFKEGEIEQEKDKYHQKSHQNLEKKRKSEDMINQFPERMRQTKECFYELEKQLPRSEKLFKNQPQPHEKRFETVLVTEIWSKIPRTPQVPMEKGLARDEMIIYKKKNYAPDYQPNSEFGKRQLGSCGPSFASVQKRKELFFKPCPYTNETYFEFEKYSRLPQSMIFRTPTSPNFDKMLDRENDPNSKLPSFMQKYVNSRMTLTNLHQKMLEVNNFSDGRFLTMTSSFGMKKKMLKKQSSLSEEEIEEEFEDQQ